MLVVRDVETGEYVEDFNLYGFGVTLTKTKEEAFEFNKKWWKLFDREHNETGEFELVEIE